LTKNKYKLLLNLKHIKKILLKENYFFKYIQIRKRLKEMLYYILMENNNLENIMRYEQLEYLKKEAEELKRESEEIKKRKEAIKERKKEIKKKIKEIETKAEEENKKLTDKQINEIDINDLFKINHIFDYSKHWQMSKDDRPKYKIVKITPQFVMVMPLKLVRKQIINNSGGYATYKSILVEEEEEDVNYLWKPLRISKNNIMQDYFFKDGSKYELNKEFNHTDDNGR